MKIIFIKIQVSMNNLLLKKYNIPILKEVLNNDLKI